MISHARATALIEAPSEALLELLAEAGEVRDRGRGRTVTFSAKVFVPLTTLCRDDCGYCTFRRDPGQPGARTLTPDEVVALCEAGARLGAKEALVEKLRSCRELGIDGQPLAETVAVTLGRGMAHDGAPDKVPAKRLRTIELAGKLAIPFTTGILIGIGETPRERVDALCAIRDLHEKYGHVQEVIVQNFRAKPGIPMREHPEPSLDDLLRALAVARLVLGPDVNIQAPPNLSPGAYGRLLEAGLNDWGGVSPLTPDHINPERPWPQLVALRAATERHGYGFRERLAIYPEFATRPEFLDERLRARVAALVGRDGFVKESHEHWRHW